MLKDPQGSSVVVSTWLLPDDVSEIDADLNTDYHWSYKLYSICRMWQFAVVCYHALAAQQLI